MISKGLNKTMPQVWRLVPRPVLGSRMALFGLALRPLLFTTRVLGGVSVGVPRFRGRALRAFWETESGWVFKAVHLTAAVTGEKRSTFLLEEWLRSFLTAAGVCVYGKTRLLLRRLSRSLLPGNANIGTFIPAAKLVCIADTGLVLSLSRSVTSGEAKSTRPLYTLEQSSLEWVCFTIAC